MRARSQNALILMGSATPSLESIRNTQLNKYQLLSLEKRVGDSMLPIVSLLDMR